MDITKLQDQLRDNRLKVDVDYFDLTLREIVRMATEGELQIAPDYQRKFRWSPKDESRLIESLFLGLPVPSVFVATNNDGTWEVIDGLQRVSTLIHYVSFSEDILNPSKSLAIVGKTDNLKLQDLNTLTELNGKTFSDLPSTLQLAFLKRLIRVTALSDKSDPKVRFDMFERLNNGGIALTSQEIRACLYQGSFITLLEELASHPLFSKIVKLQSKNQEDGTKEEIILKLFAYLYDRDSFSGAVKDFLNDFAEEKGDKLDHSVLRQLFDSTVTKLYEVIKGPIGRPHVGWSPLNQVEAVLVAAAELVQDGNKSFCPKEGWLNDTQLKRFSTGGTNTRGMLKGRINRARDLLMGAAVETKDKSSVR